MKNKIIILYDLKEKTNLERTRILQILYNHQEKSNYKYSYKRKGLLNNFDIEKTGKTVIYLKNKNDIAKISEILIQLKIKFEIMQS